MCAKCPVCASQYRHPIYRESDGCQHEGVSHSAREHVRGDAHTQGIESF